MKGSDNMHVLDRLHKFPEKSKNEIFGWSLITVIIVLSAFLVFLVIEYICACFDGIPVSPW